MAEPLQKKLQGELEKYQQLQKGETTPKKTPNTPKNHPGTPKIHLKPPGVHRAAKKTQKIVLKHPWDPPKFTLGPPKIFPKNFSGIPPKSPQKNHLKPP